MPLNECVRCGTKVLSDGRSSDFLCGPCSGAAANPATTTAQKPAPPRITSRITTSMSSLRCPECKTSFSLRISAPTATTGCPKCQKVLIVHHDGSVVTFEEYTLEKKVPDRPAPFRKRLRNFLRFRKNHRQTGPAEEERASSQPLVSTDEAPGNVFVKSDQDIVNMVSALMEQPQTTKVQEAQPASSPEPMTEPAVAETREAAIKELESEESLPAVPPPVPVPEKHIWADEGPQTETVDPAAQPPEHPALEPLLPVGSASTPATAVNDDPPAPPDLKERLVVSSPIPASATLVPLQEDLQPLESERKVADQEPEPVETTAEKKKTSRIVREQKEETVPPPVREKRWIPVFEMNLAYCAVLLLAPIVLGGLAFAALGMDPVGRWMQGIGGRVSRGMVALLEGEPEKKPTFVVHHPSDHKAAHPSSLEDILKQMPESKTPKPKPKQESAPGPQRFPETPRDIRQPPQQQQKQEEDDGRTAEGDIAEIMRMRDSLARDFRSLKQSLLVEPNNPRLLNLKAEMELRENRLNQLKKAFEKRWGRSRLEREFRRDGYDPDENIVK